jgi:hypothetical protein
MLVPDFGPTMNVIAYSPFHDGVSAKAVGGSDRAIVSGAAHKPTRLLRRSGAIGFSSRPSCMVREIRLHTLDFALARRVVRGTG